MSKKYEIVVSSGPEGDTVRERSADRIAEDYRVFLEDLMVWLRVESDIAKDYGERTKCAAYTDVLHQIRDWVQEEGLSVRCN